MRKKELRMQIRYEVNRLSKNYLSRAYEQLVPIITHPIESQERANGYFDSADKQLKVSEEEYLSEGLSSHLKRNKQ